MLFLNRNISGMSFRGNLIVIGTLQSFKIHVGQGKVFLVVKTKAIFRKIFLELCILKTSEKSIRLNFILGLRVPFQAK